MAALSLSDPLSNNILLKELGAIIPRDKVLELLTILPALRADLHTLSRDERLREILQLRQFHVPRLVEGRLFESLDMMIREGYRYRNPEHPSTFADLSGERTLYVLPKMPPTAAAVNGIAGSGKSVSIELCLGLIPKAYLHESFPRMAGEHLQIFWQSIEAPKSGRTEDLWRTLMADMDAITGTGRFASRLAAQRGSLRSSAALHEWLTIAKGHFLGLLHIDEIQNLFRLSTLARRRKRKDDEGPPELSLVEDETLRWLLAFMNAGIPLAISGTPDGIEAMSSRLSTLQRYTSMGAHLFTPFRDPDDKDYGRFIMNISRYQYTKTTFAPDEDFKKHLFKLTAGVPRILVTLWVAANRIALESPKDVLEPRHFEIAESKFLAPLRPAVHALQNAATPAALAAYDDLVTKHPDLWLEVWGQGT